jgi:hypothetical protein
MGPWWRREATATRGVEGGTCAVRDSVSIDEALVLRPLGVEERRSAAAVVVDCRRQQWWWSGVPVGGTKCLDGRREDWGWAASEVESAVGSDVVRWCPGVIFDGPKIGPQAETI